MTTWRLMDGLAGRPGDGPSLTPYTATPFQAALLFTVTQGGLWLQAFWWWVPAGGDTAAQEFCLYSVTGSGGSASVVPGSTVTSGTLTENAWNRIALTSPVQVAIGGTYTAATAWAPAHGFPDTQFQFGTGNPYAAGITNGPLHAYGDGTSGGSDAAPYGYPQGLFGTATADPTAGMPAGGSNASNFGIDVEVSDTAPAGYTGSYRLWPNMAGTSPSTTLDSTVSDDVSTEFALSQSCALNRIWYYSPAGAGQLATAASIWSITGGGLTGIKVAGTTSPAWSGAAGSGWLSCPFTGTVLPAGKYKVSVYNGGGGAWAAKDANTDYWRTGPGAAGITSGPLTAPGLGAASLAYNYNGDAGGTPPYSDGTTLAGQPTFSLGPPDAYPYLFAAVGSPSAGSTQNYWVDAEVTPIDSGTGSVRLAKLGLAGAGFLKNAGAGSARIAKPVLSGSGILAGRGTGTVALAKMRLVATGTTGAPLVRSGTARAGVYPLARARQGQWP